MIWRRSLSTFLFSIVLFGDKTSPSNLTLRDFVAAIAGRFLRRLCDSSLFSYFRFRHCERLRFVVARDYESIWWEITHQSCEILRINLVIDYIRIWIIQSAVRFDRRYEWTADVYSISRRLYFQLFFLLTNIPVQSYSPLRVLRRSISTAVMLGVTARPAKRERVKARSNAQCCSEWAFLRRLCSGLLLGLSLHCYRVPGIRWHNNRRLALWSRYNPAGLQLLFYGLILSLWEITLHCYSDYISIWIIQPAVRFDRRYDLTAESLYISFFNCSFWR